MKSISEVWNEQPEYYNAKSLAQIIGIIHDGKLRDGNLTSQQFRELLNGIDSFAITRFINDCLTDKFENSGLALQDIVNQIGSRLEFEIEYGLYQGVKNAIGFDGIWKNKDGYSLIIEVKTTDAYRLNLDVISSYRKKLGEAGIVEFERSSILIVVGRQDTGDLEAQIRGSKHAWDIRLVSTDSLLQLLKLKENFNDLRTINQINELLKPNEYTRIDSLIQIITSTLEDLTDIDIDIKDEEGQINPISEDKKKKSAKEQTTKPSGFHEECMIRIRAHLKISLVKRSRINYSDTHNLTGLICIVSKIYFQSDYNQYWFSFHPYQADFLAAFRDGFIAFGCGSPDKILLVPFKELLSQLEYLNVTNLPNKYYYHIHINERNSKFFLLLHKKTENKEWDITKYLI